jgi:hypothetical protein
MVSVAQKLSTTEEWHKEQNCLFQRDYRYQGQKPEKFLGLSLSKDDGFRDNSIQFFIISVLHQQRDGKLQIQKKKNIINTTK